MLRIDCRIKAVALCDTGLRLPCETLNLSQQGIKLRMDKPLRDFRGHSIEQIEIKGVGQLSVGLRWVAGHEAGLALTGDQAQRDLVTALLNHLEGKRRAALAAQQRGARTLVRKGQH